MNQTEIEMEKVWTALDTKVSTINERTKRQTIQIRELSDRIKKLEEKK